MISGLGQTVEAELNPHKTPIGRGTDCDCVLNDPRVFRRHTRLYHGFQFFLEAARKSLSQLCTVRVRNLRSPGGIAGSSTLGPME